MIISISLTAVTVHSSNFFFLVMRTLSTLLATFKYAIQDSVQFSSVTQVCPTLCDPMNHSTPGLPVHHQLQELVQTHVHWVSDAIHHLILCRPLSSHPQSFPAPGSSQMSQLFTSGGWSIGVPASTSVLPVNTQDWSPLGDWLDILSVQGTLKSLLPHHTSKASILWCSAFFIVQISHPYMTTGKTIALTRQTFDGKVRLLTIIYHVIPYIPMAYLFYN